MSLFEDLDGPYTIIPLSIIASDDEELLLLLSKAQLSHTPTPMHV